MSKDSEPQNPQPEQPSGSGGGSCCFFSGPSFVEFLGEMSSIGY